jgi:hypothetical protein
VDWAFPAGEIQPANLDLGSKSSNRVSAACAGALLVRLDCRFGSRLYLPRVTATACTGHSLAAWRCLRSKWDGIQPEVRTPRPDPGSSETEVMENSKHGVPDSV